MKSEYKIVITNDDGLFSEGLIPLVKEITKLGDVCIIVPEREMSAVSHSLSLLVPVRVKEITLNGFNIKLVSGTPADCVRLGIIEFQKRKTNIVISGINQGPNLGYDVNYSGTVAAAREAMFLGVAGVAVSSVSSDYKLVAEITREIVKFYLDSGYKQLLNINFPKVKPKGIKVTTLGERRYQDVIYKKRDPIGIPYYWLKSKLIKNDEKKDLTTDVAALNNGYISVTPLTFDVTNYKELNKTSLLFKRFLLK
ncbi:MAG: 5'/3'-nucleotidase SurE [Endomicrobia bacterium]|nr:5'/3'-nucleotidase SurE [Endomicrobiia bacterium]MDW8056026.1 5'/3'-nucleotidase SurE [Elusimicrobiota bacterium]